MKSNQSVRHWFDQATQEHVVEVLGHPQIRVKDSAISPENGFKARGFGIRQVRFIDGAAIGKTDKDGRMIPEATRLQMKYEGIRRIADHVASGSPEWELPRAGAVRVPKVDALELVLEAIARATGRDAAAVNKMLVSMVAQRGGDLEANARHLAETARVQIALTELKAERAPRAVDADATLDELIASE